MYTCNPRNSLKKLTYYNRLILRREYYNLIIENMESISSLDIRDKKGKIIEYGYTIIEKVLDMERKHKNIDEQIQIIGKSKWLSLKRLWKRMREIENEDKNLISKLK